MAKLAIHSLLALVLLQQPSLSPKIVIEGRIMRASTPEPVAIPGARVELAGPGGFSQIVSSDAAGRFRLADVVAGQYRLSVMAAGYVTAQYGQQAYNLPGAPLTVVAGKQVDSFLFKLVPTATITGTVRDYDGEPLAGVRVDLLKPRYSPGRRTLTAALSTRTDDRGEFRLYAVTPDEYFISATYAPSTRGGPAFPQNPNAAPSRTGYLPVFFNNTTDASRAGAITLSPGETLDGISFRLAPDPSANISGTVTDSRIGRGAQVILYLQGTAMTLQTQSDVSGRYEFRGVPSGSYGIRVEAVSGNPVQTYRALEVAGKDIVGFDFVLEAGISIRAHVSFEGTDTPPSLARANIALSAPGMSSFGRVQPDGNVEFANVQKGAFQLNVSGLPEDFYLKEARLGAIDAMNEAIPIRGEIRDSLEILISGASGRIKGTIVDSNNLPYSTAAVALVPESKFRDKSTYYKTAASDQNGAFSFRGIPPGNYTLFAWDYIETGAYYNPEFIRQHEPKGLTLRIEASSEKDMRLQVIEH